MRRICSSYTLGREHRKKYFPDDNLELWYEAKCSTQTLVIRMASLESINCRRNSRESGFLEFILLFPRK